jgi:acyl carrier protein
MQSECQSNYRAVVDRSDVLKNVKEIVGEHMGMQAEQIKESHALIEDLGCDSLDLVEIAMELEEHFDIAIPDGFDEQMRTIGDVTDGVLQLIGKERVGAN